LKSPRRRLLSSTGPRDYRQTASGTWADIRSGVQAVPHKPELIHKASSVGIIHVGGTRGIRPIARGSGKQAPLGEKVRLHVRVVVEVVLGEIREQRGGKRHPRDPPLVERV